MFVIYIFTVPVVNIKLILLILFAKISFGPDLAVANTYWKKYNAGKIYIILTRCSNALDKKEYASTTNFHYVKLL